MLIGDPGHNEELATFFPAASSCSRGRSHTAESLRDAHDRGTAPNLLSMSSSVHRIGVDASEST